jgi:hypothetical protein
MDMLEIAAQSDDERDVALDDLSDRIQGLRDQRAVRHAAEAIVLVREVCPEASLVLFEGPQEPGSTATILRLVAADGEVLYDLDGGVVPDGFDELRLEPAEDHLTGALEDNASIFALGLGGAYVLPVGRS